jgi:hypothetical protein
MSVPTAVPLKIEPEAAERVAELGVQAEFERMLEQVRQTVPDLRRIEVILVPPYDTGDEPGIVIEAFRDAAPGAEDGPLRNQWRDWELATFPPDVYRHFVVRFLYEGGHAG